MMIQGLRRLRNRRGQFRLGGFGPTGPCGCCPGGGGTCAAPFCFQTCAGANLSGATFTVKSGGTTVASGTTDASGCVTLNITDGSTYDLDIAYGGNTLTLSGIVLSCLGLTAFLAVITVNGCTTVLPGASVTVTPPAGYSLATTTFTTDASGQVAFPWYNALTGYGLSISYPRFATYTTPGGGCPTITLTPASGYHCGCSCNIPICDTLDLTDSVLGSCTLTYTSGTWQGTINYAFPAFCGCNAATVPVLYTLHGDCSLSISFPVGVGQHNICNNTNAPHCPLAASGSTALISPTAGGKTCNPLDASWSMSACSCATCILDGVGEGCTGGGANPNGALWQATSTTITVTDSC